MIEYYFYPIIVLGIYYLYIWFIKYPKVVKDTKLRNKIMGVKQ
jgi:hypothetical protein